MATYEILDYGSPDGSQWGNASTDKLGMYGKTPVTRYVGAGAASTYLSYKQSTGTASTWGFDSQAAVTSFILQVSTLTTALRNFGLID